MKVKPIRRSGVVNVAAVLLAILGVLQGCATDRQPRCKGRLEPINVPEARDSKPVGVSR